MATPEPISPQSRILERRVLVICNDPAAIDRYRAILARNKYSLLITETAARALEVLASNADVAVMLLDMGPNSHALAEQIYAQAESLEDIECVIVGNQAPTADADSIGAERLKSPFRDDELLAAVESAYNLARMQRFRFDEMRSLESSLLEFRTQTLTAVSRLIVRAQKAQGRLVPLSRLEAASIGSQSDFSLHTFIQDETRRARLREKIFGSWASSHAAWLLILAIAEAQLAEAPLTVKSAAYSAGLPLSSALRRINDMCDVAMVTKKEDPRDARRSFVSLTPAGLAQLALYASEFSPDQTQPQTLANRRKS